MKPGVPETFKVEYFDYYSIGQDYGTVQIGEVTFSKEQTRSIESLSSTSLALSCDIIEVPFKHKTAFFLNNTPYESSNIAIPKNVKVAYNVKYKDGFISNKFYLYDIDENDYIGGTFYLVRPTGQLVATVASKVASTVMSPFRQSAPDQSSPVQSSPVQSSPVQSSPLAYN